MPARVMQFALRYEFLASRESGSFAADEPRVA